MTSPRSSSATSGATFICFTLLGWSSVPLFLKYFAVMKIDAWTVNGWRYAVAALMWAPLLLVATQSGQTPRAVWRLAIVPSLINCAGQVCFALAPYRIDAGWLAFLIRFQIIFVAFGAYMLFPGERRTIRSPLFWGGVLVVLAGSVATVFLGTNVPRGAAAAGVILALASGALFGCYAVAVRYYMNRIGSVISFAVISLYTAVGMIALMLWLGTAHGAMPLLRMSGADLLLLVLSAVVGISLGHVCYYASIARLGVSIAAGVTLLAPFLTAIGSNVLYHERLTAGQWLGGVASTIGAVMILATQRRLGTRSTTSDDTRLLPDNPVESGSSPSEP